MIETRLAVPEDSDVLCDLALTMIEESDYAQDGVNAQRLRSGIETACADEGSTGIVVVEDAGRIVGAAMYAITTPWFATYRILVDQAVYVVADYRASGVGQHLIAGLRLIAFDAGCKRIQLGSTANIDNAAVHKSYIAAGFEPVGINYRMVI